MSKALFVTIGSRDVLISRQDFVAAFGEATAAEVFQQKPGRPEVFLARPGGKKLLEQWDTVAEALTFPILKPFITYLLRKPIEFDQVYLVATNQAPDMVGDYALQDTIYFAEIIKRHLTTRYAKANYVPFKKVNILEVTENVIYLDAMFNHFKERFANQNFNALEGATEIHLSNQGGIDAINTGLMLQLLYKYAGKVFLYNINEQTKVCTPLEFQAQFGYEQEKARFIQAVKRHDYAGARSLPLTEQVQAWCAYAESRLNFDFDSAQQHLERISGDYRSKRDFEITDIQSTRSDETKLTAELYWNAMIRFEQEAYVDFVQRFFRIVEQIARYEVQKIMDFPFDHRKWEQDFVKGFLKKPENAELKQHLDDFKVASGAALNYSEANIEVFMAILKYQKPDMHQFLQALRPLAQLRNQGIGAHGFSPIGKKQILDKMQTDEAALQQMLEEVRSLLGAGPNPYDRIQGILSSLI